MSSVFLGMTTDQIHGALVDVDAEAKKKLDAILAETIEDAGKIAGEPVTKDNVYFVANQIALAAFKSFENWAAENFTVSPSKELAGAWVKGSFHHFAGATSIQKEIRQKLLH
jgi:hypothetical protein